MIRWLDKWLEPGVKAIVIFVALSIPGFIIDGIGKTVGWGTVFASALGIGALIASLIKASLPIVLFVCAIAVLGRIFDWW